MATLLPLIPDHNRVMKTLTGIVSCGLAVALLAAAPAVAQRVCKPGDQACSEQRTKVLRDETTRSLDRRQGPYDAARERNVRNRANTRQTRDTMRDRSSPCDVKPIISGEGTRVVPTC